MPPQFWSFGNDSVNFPTSKRGRSSLETGGLKAAIEWNYWRRTQRTLKALNLPHVETTERLRTSAINNEAIVLKRAPSYLWTCENVMYSVASCVTRTNKILKTQKLSSQIHNYRIWRPHLEIAQTSAVSFRIETGRSEIESKIHRADHAEL